MMTIVNLFTLNFFIDHCDFEFGFCNWTNERRTDVFDWTRHRGSAVSSFTGPWADHTKRNSNGKNELFHNMVDLEFSSFLVCLSPQAIRTKISCNEILFVPTAQL